MNYNKQLLVEAIADELCQSVDMKTLLQMYYDDQVSYMQDMDDEELFEWAESYLQLTPEEVIEHYGDNA